MDAGHGVFPSGCGPGGKTKAAARTGGTRRPPLRLESGVRASGSRAPDSWTGGDRLVRDDNSSRSGGGASSGAWPVDAARPGSIASSFASGCLGACPSAGRARGSPSTRSAPRPRRRSSGPRAGSPTSVMPAASASSIASEVGAPTAASAGMRARAALSTSSAPARPLTHSRPSPAPCSPSRSSQPQTLSTALWRPTSSRSTRGSSAPSHQTAACSPPVSANAAWPARNRSGSARTAAASKRPASPAGARPARSDSRCARPQMPARGGGREVPLELRPVERDARGEPHVEHVGLVVARRGRAPRSRRRRPRAAARPRWRGSRAPARRRDPACAA